VTGEGWGEGEKSKNFAKLFIPLPFITLPSRQGVKGKIYFLQDHQICFLKKLAFQLHGLLSTFIRSIL